jgi:hypothetical protein
MRVLLIPQQQSIAGNVEWRGKLCRVTPYFPDIDGGRMLLPSKDVIAFLEVDEDFQLGCWNGVEDGEDSSRLDSYLQETIGNSYWTASLEREDIVDENGRFILSKHLAPTLNHVRRGDSVTVFDDNFDAMAVGVVTGFDGDVVCVDIINQDGDDDEVSVHFSQVYTHVYHNEQQALDLRAAVKLEETMPEPQSQPQPQPKRRISKEDAIAKAKKCLALSQSANENEAAIALRQAQKLMAEFGFSLSDIEQAEVEEKLRELGAKNIAPWKKNLFATVASAFSCTPVMESHRKTIVFKFVGVSPQPEIADYCFEVLLAQLEKERKQYVKKLGEEEPWLSSTQKQTRANHFALAWTIAVNDKVEVFAQKPPKVVGDYLRSKMPALRKSRTRSVSANPDDLRCGRESGSNVSLHHGMGGGAAPPKMIGGGR